MAVFVNSKELDTQQYVIPDNKTSEPDCVGHWPPIKARMFTSTFGRKLWQFLCPPPHCRPRLPPKSVTEYCAVSQDSSLPNPSLRQKVVYWDRGRLLSKMTIKALLVSIRQIDLALHLTSTTSCLGASPLARWDSRNLFCTRWRTGVENSDS